jgi:flagellar motility protein MotE (MotC chaperone)
LIVTKKGLRLNYKKFLKTFICFHFLANLFVFFSYSEEKKEEVNNEVRIFKKDTNWLLSEKIINEISKKEEYNNKKSQELKLKEKEIAEKEKALNEEINRLEDAKKEIFKSKETMNDLKKEKVAKLMQTFLYMNPKSVSKILSKLDNSLAVQILNEMENERLAKIMNNMSPERSAELSEMMSGYYHVTQKERR